MKKINFIIYIIACISICFNIYIFYMHRKGITKYNVSIQATVLSNDGTKLRVKGAIDSADGNNGQYIVRKSSKYKVLNLQKEEVPFSAIEQGDSVIIYYQWELTEEERFSTKDVFALREGQKIPDITEITIVE